MRAVQTKQCGTVSIITTVFNKVQEIMKTAKKAISPKKVKSLAKERSLPKKKQSTCRDQNEENSDSENVASIRAENALLPV